MNLKDTLLIQKKGPRAQSRPTGEGSAVEPSAGGAARAAAPTIHTRRRFLMVVAPPTIFRRDAD